MLAHHPKELCDARPRHGRPDRATTRLMRCSKSCCTSRIGFAAARQPIKEGAQVIVTGRSTQPSATLKRNWARMVSRSHRCYEVRRGRLTVPTSGSRSVDDIAHGLAVLFRIGTSSSHDAIL